MRERFNHARVAVWEELGDYERNWLGWLGRFADDRELVKEWQYRDHAMFFEAEGLDFEQLTQAHLVESLALVFATRIPRIAFRALLQAAEYMGHLGDDGRRLFLDAFTAAKYRAEKMLGVEP